MEEKRVPPHSLEAEEAVLGAVLLDQKALAKVMEILREEHFYSAANQKIYRGVLDLFNHNVTADLVTVTDWLKQNKLLDGIGGPEYVSNIVGNVLTTANVEHHARVVLDKATKRTIIRTSMELLKNSFDDSESAAELVDYAQNSVFQIKESGLRKDPVHIRSFITGILEAAEAMRGDRMITGVETGYYKLDEMTSGFQKGDFVVIAGRPSMGKTAIALNIASYAAIENNIAIGIFSLEMSGEALVQRLLCSEAKVSLRNLRRGSLRNEDWVNLATAAGNLDKAPIFIDDSPMLSMYELKAKARRLKAEHNIEMIMVDYLQLLEGPQTFRSTSRQQEISEISRALKGLAKELDIPVIVVSQLSRMPEHRQDRRPLLADLRESGAIEQDADVVIFLYREEVYDRETEKKGIAEVNIAKQRNGPTGMLELGFQGEYTLFANITFREEEREEEEEYEPF
ncbi:MAG: replicative DNA helicase [candidate division WOR-3 bacterium]|nr:MAG: replicative DNA helicase [candidate division WOR-3 bacterium]